MSLQVSKDQEVRHSYEEACEVICHVLTYCPSFEQESKNKVEETNTKDDIRKLWFWQNLPIQQHPLAPFHNIRKSWMQKLLKIRGYKWGLVRKIGKTIYRNLWGTRFFTFVWNINVPQGMMIFFNLVTSLRCFISRTRGFFFCYKLKGFISPCKTFASPSTWKWSARL